VSTQVRRIEVGRHTPIVYLQLIGFGAFVILFVYPEMVWALTAYRPNDPAELVRKFNDFAWLGFVCIVSTGMMQMVTLGYVILTDRRPQPVYPRWFGYFNVWVAFMFIPADIIFFFKTGPMAWNGVIGFGVSFGAFFLWTFLVTYLTGKAVTAQGAAGEDGPEDAPLAEQVAALSEQVAILRHQFDQDREIARSRLLHIAAPGPTSG
jgi:drug/metabolite transporter (DMT)-like permease